jgi:hypothetical protein
LQGLSKKPEFKPMRRYSGWTDPAQSGWQVNGTGKHGKVTLNDYGCATTRQTGSMKREWGNSTRLCDGVVHFPDIIGIGIMSNPAFIVLLSHLPKNAELLQLQDTKSPDYSGKRALPRPYRYKTSFFQGLPSLRTSGFTTVSRNS